MFGIGFGEILILAFIALILFGQEDLPSNIRKAANGLKEFRKVTSNAQRAWHEVRSDMTRALLEESEKETDGLKTVSVGGAVAPVSSLEHPEVELEKDDGHDHHHLSDEHPFGDETHEVEVKKPAAAPDKIQGASSASIVIKAPQGIIAHGTQLDDEGHVAKDHSSNA